MSKKFKYQNPARTIKHMLELVTEKFPERDAFKIKVKGEIMPVTFSKLTETTYNLGTELYSMGYEDKRIGIIGDNSYPWFEVFMSVVCGGGVAVPFDKGFTAEELAVCIRRSGISAFFYDEKQEKVVLAAAEIYNSMEDKGADVVLYKMTGNGAVVEGMKAGGAEKVAAGSSCYTSYFNKEVTADQPAVILFTSGTTSTSKAVVLTNNNIMSNIRDMHQFEDFYPDDVNFSFLPLHHSFGLVGVLVFMACGACTVFCDGLKYITKNLQEYGVTVFVGVPLLVESMYKKIMQTVRKSGKEKKLRTGDRIATILEKLGIDVRRRLFREIIDNLGGRMRLIICGAAPLMPEAGKGLNSFGIATIQGYGLTETSPVLCAERPEDICPGSVGKPMPSVKVRIDEPDENGVGEIVVSGPNIMAGYLDQPEATAEVIIDGWFHTGDLGKVDDKGNVWIMGRKKSLIVMKSGKKIFPEEIETNLGALPYVKDSMVFAREDKHNELVLWVKIVYNEEYLVQENIDVNGLAERVKKDLEALNKTMPHYKNINHFILDNEPMIMTTTQKVKRVPETKRINENRESELAFTV